MIVVEMKEFDKKPDVSNPNKRRSKEKTERTKLVSVDSFTVWRKAGICESKNSKQLYKFYWHINYDSNG